jgi:hypothetical protein
MRLTLVHLVGLRNRLFAFLDVAEKASDSNISAASLGSCTTTLKSPASY